MEIQLGRIAINPAAFGNIMLECGNADQF